MSHTSLALLGPLLLVLLAGLAIGAAHATQTGDPADVGRVVLAAFVQVPAAWVVVGLVVAAYGLVPRLVPAGWAALVLFLLVGELGPLLGLPAWAMDLSPFTHVPHLPGGDFVLAPLLWLTGLAAALVVAGLVGFRRRDVSER